VAQVLLDMDASIAPVLLSSVCAITAIRRGISADRSVAPPLAGCCRGGEFSSHSLNRFVAASAARTLLPPGHILMAWSACRQGTGRAKVTTAASAWEYKR
jgi:hypothetical protein